MALSIGNKGTATSAWGATTDTLAFNNNGTLLMVGISARDDGGSPIDGITYNGVALTHVITETSAPAIAGIWELHNNLATGVNNLIWAGNIDRAVMFAMSILGANLGDPIGDTDKTNAFATTITRTLTYEAITSMTFGVGYAKDSGSHTFTWNANTTEHYDLNPGSEMNCALVTRDEREATSTVTLMHDWEKLGLAVAEIRMMRGSTKGYVIG